MASIAAQIASSDRGVIATRVADRISAEPVIRAYSENRYLSPVRVRSVPAILVTDERFERIMAFLESDAIVEDFSIIMYE